MNFDTKAEIFESVSAAGLDGSVTLSYTSVGFVWVSDSKVSKKLIITAAREAAQIEQVLESRWSSKLRGGVFLRTHDMAPNSYLEVTRADEVGRKKGFTLYCKFTQLTA